MTVAVCLKCGAMKRGAWQSCPACRYLPESPEDQAKAVILSDHVLSKQDLLAVSDRIKQGEEVTFRDDQVQKLAQSIATQAPKMKRELQRYGVGCALFVVVVILLILFFIWRQDAASP
jgi:hypothetical protein